MLTDVDRGTTEVFHLWETTDDLRITYDIATDRESVIGKPVRLAPRPGPLSSQLASAWSHPRSQPFSLSD